MFRVTLVQRFGLGVAVVASGCFGGEFSALPGYDEGLAGHPGGSASFAGTANVGGRSNAGQAGSQTHAGFPGVAGSPLGGQPGSPGTSGGTFGGAGAPTSPTGGSTQNPGSGGAGAPSAGSGQVPQGGQQNAGGDVGNPVGGSAGNPNNQGGMAMSGSAGASGSPMMPFGGRGGNGGTAGSSNPIAGRGGAPSVGGSGGTPSEAGRGGTTSLSGAGMGGRAMGGAGMGGAGMGGQPMGGSTSAGSSPGGSAGMPNNPGTVTKFVGNITTHDSVDTDGKVFSRHWNQITPENAGKWGSVQPTAGAAFNWRTLDAIYDYAQRNNVIFKQHAFVWGSQQPSGTLSEADVKRWISEFCKRYPNTKLIDVVNEPPPHTTPSYANAIGGGTNGNWQWITNSFKWARESCPGAILILNDYNNIEYGDQVNHFINIVKTVKAAGAPVDAVGAQAHALDDAGVTFQIGSGFLNRLNQETGLPVYITEFDISTADDAAQLRKYEEYIPFFLQTDYIKGITIWGWIYGKTWSQAAQSGLIRNGSPRPAMTYLMQQIGRPAQ